MPVPKTRSILMAVVVAAVLAVATAIVWVLIDYNRPAVTVAPTPPVVVNTPVVTEPTVPAKEPNITVSKPKPNDTVSAPFIIRGTARVFENQLNWRVRDTKGKVLVEGMAYANAPDAGLFGPYEVAVSSLTPKTTTGTVEVFDYSAEDGREIDTVVVPVTFGSDRKTTLKVFFQKEGSECGDTFAVDRILPHTEGVARAALEALIAGPTPEEVRRGYVSTLPAGVVIKRLFTDETGLFVDFNAALTAGVTKCRAETIRAQITNTLQQFPTVKALLITVEGKWPSGWGDAPLSEDAL